MISVVGAGPAGCHYASLVDKDVTMFEEHEKVGFPVQCTGILTDSIYRVLEDVPKDVIITKIKTFRVIAPNKKQIDINLDKENLVVDRCKFDGFLMQKAVDNGAKILMGHRFLGFKEQNNKFIIKTNKGSFESDMLVGADGPRSPVAKAAEIYGKREFLQGLQARVYYNGEPGVSEVRLGLGEFAWIVPENEKIARIGVIGTNIGADYKKLIGDCKIIENQHGTLPIYNPKQKLKAGNVFLIGDAATQVKATTYGGVIYGLLAGKLLAEDPDNYEKNFNKKLGKDLWLSLQMREAMNNMSEKESNELIEVFRKHDTRKILEKYDRDFPSKFIVQLLLKEKSLWKLSFSTLAKKFFKKD